MATHNDDGEIIQVPTYGDSPVSFERGKFTVTLATETDCDADLSHIGEWVRREPVGVRPSRIIRHNDRRDGYTWFVCQDYGDEVSDADMARYALEDYRRFQAYERGNWQMLGLTVKVSCQGVQLAHASLWGIESDSDESYFREVFRDLTADATTEAESTLSKLALAVA